MINLDNTEIEFNRAVSDRKYYEMYVIVNDVTKQYITSGKFNDSTSSRLINMNSDALEYLGASKQFESAHELHAELIKNRISLLAHSLEDRPALVSSFYRIVGRK